MKRTYFTLSLVFSLAILAVSCTKKVDQPSQPESLPLSVEEYMTGKTWQLQEARFNQLNDQYYYMRGVTSNGHIYDVDSIRFNSNNTGTYYNSGGMSNFTWAFLDVQKTKLLLTHPGNYEVNWINVHVTDTAFRYAEYYTIPGTTTKSMGAFYRIQRPGSATSGK